MFWSSDSRDLDYEEELEALVIWENAPTLYITLTGNFGNDDNEEEDFIIYLESPNI